MSESKSFPALLKDHAAEIARALPAHLSADRMARIALTSFRRNPKLAECDPKSVFACVIQSAQLGLEPDTLGRSYLIPYKVNRKGPNGWESHYECQFVPGWKGLVDLMNRSGNGSVWTGAVFKGDDFDYQLGDSPYVRHKPRSEDDGGVITHVYAVGRTKGSEWPVIEVWTAARVEKHRNRYNKVGDRHYSFENWEMYARKVVLLQVMKYMPCSAEMVQAMALNDAGEIGRQMLSVPDAIDGTWVPAPNDDEQPPEEGAPGKSGADRLKAAVKSKESAGPAAGATSGAGSAATDAAPVPADPAKPTKGGGPTLDDAIKAIRKKDYDLAADIASIIQRHGLHHLGAAWHVLHDL